MKLLDSNMFYKEFKFKADRDFIVFCTSCFYIFRVIPLPRNLRQPFILTENLSWSKPESLHSHLRNYFLQSWCWRTTVTELKDTRAVKNHEVALRVAPDFLVLFMRKIFHSILQEIDSLQVIPVLEIHYCWEIRQWFPRNTQGCGADCIY